MIGDNRNYTNCDQSFDRWIKINQNTPKTVNINTCIPMQRKSILSIIPSIESMTDLDDEGFTEAQWLNLCASKDSIQSIKSNLKTIKSNIIRYGTPRSV